MIKFCDEGYMFQYKILKAKQPFLYSVEKNEWTDLKKEVISGFSKGNYSLSMPDGQGNIVKLTEAECGYISPYKLYVLGNGYMCAISFGSRVDNLVVSGLEVNGTFLHNFKAHKTLQRSFIVNKGEYKEFQDNSGPCNIKELVIHTNKGIFVERK